MAHRLPVADIQFIADFAVFARSKGDEAYDYLSRTPGIALVAQFLRASRRLGDAVGFGGAGGATGLANSRYNWPFPPGQSDAFINQSETHMDLLLPRRPP
jgi:hypothetical protein